ncbi:Replicative DNA helicase [subsurface metagenome]
MYGDKLPPHDSDAEENVIGSLLVDGTAIYKIATFLQRQDFYNEPSSLIYEACLSLQERDEAIDQITVAQELAHQGKLEVCGGAAYLSHLVSIVATSLHIEHYAKIVYRLSIMRRLINAGSQIAAIGYEADPDVDGALNRAEDVLFKLRHGQSQQGFTHIRQVLDKYFEVTPPTADTDHVEPISQVLSGFSKLDELLGGFQRSDLVIVAGRPSMGKTSFILSIVTKAAVEQGACVALFSLEMAREPLVLRMLSNKSGVDSRRLRLGLQSEDEEKRIMDATGILSEAPIYIDDSPQLRVVEMRAKARRLHFERGINLIIVDYLQLMQGEARTESEVEKINYISRSLKALARDLNIPVIAVSQMSRAAEWRASHRPQLFDLRGSGSIEQDADQVLFIYREEYYYPTEEEWIRDHADKEYPKGIANIIIAKHRNGPTGEIDLRFLPKTAKFEDISITSEEPSLL